MKTNIGITLLTYPRSGVTIFKDLLDQHDVYLDSTHSVEAITGNERIASIIRNPVDSVVSHHAMGSHYGNDVGIDRLIQQYIAMYNEIINKAECLVRYDDLMEHTDQAVKLFLDHFNLKYEKTIYNKNRLYDNVVMGHLVSSKISDHYEISANMILDHTVALEQAWDIFYKADSLAKNIPTTRGKIYWKT